MRRKELIVHVANVVSDYWEWNESQDLADAVLGDTHAFHELAQALNTAGDGDPDGITVAFEGTAQSLSDEEKDWIAGDTDDASREDHPAAFLADRVTEVHSP